MKPLWITIDGHFEGHQGHFADCFFSNATGAAILFALQEGQFGDASWSIRPMTAEELKLYPEAVTFAEGLKTEYGEN